MVKEISIDFNPERKLMKSFFSLSETIASLRDLHPDVLATISLEEFYRVFIDFVDLARHIRNQQDFVLHPQRNPQIKEDPMGSYPGNPGGLIKLKFRGTIYPYSAEEKILLNTIQTSLIEAWEGIRVSSTKNIGKRMNKRRVKVRILKKVRDNRSNSPHIREGARKTIKKLNKAFYLKRKKRNH